MEDNNKITTDMLESYFNSDPTSFNEPPTHKITTDHPYMATLGLSSMTTGTLYRWWFKQDQFGNFTNREHFGNAIDKLGDASQIFGRPRQYGEKAKYPDQLAFDGWRRDNAEGGHGSYVRKYADNGDDPWNFVEFTANEAGRARMYDYSQINFPPAVFAAEENVFNQWGYIDTYSFGYPPHYLFSGSACV